MRGYAAGMAVERWARTADGRLHVLLYADQTAELIDGRGRVLMPRGLLATIAASLVARGVDSADLIADTAV